MTLALIAGAGEMPRLIYEAQDAPPFVASLAGFAPDGLQADLTFRLEHLGSALAELKIRGVSQICMIGRVRRPSIDPTQIDDATKPMVPRLAQALVAGDDAAARALVDLFEEAGFAVVGVHQVAGDLLPAPGVWAGTLTEQIENDALRAQRIVAAMGQADVGQACIVAKGQAIAIEAMPGTDWMIHSLLAPSNGSIAFENAQRDPETGSGGVLFKAPKPGQELRVDMPTIGPDTLRNAAKAGLNAVVIAAGSVLMLDPPRCCEIANDSQITLWVRP